MFKAISCPSDSSWFRCSIPFGEPFQAGIKVLQRHTRFCVSGRNGHPEQPAQTPLKSQVITQEGKKYTLTLYEHKRNSGANISQWQQHMFERSEEALKAGLDASLLEGVYSVFIVGALSVVDMKRDRNRGVKSKKRELDRNSAYILTWSVNVGLSVLEVTQFFGHNLVNLSKVATAQSKILWYK